MSEPELFSRISSSFYELAEPVLKEFQLDRYSFSYEDSSLIGEFPCYFFGELNFDCSVLRLEDSLLSEYSSSSLTS